MAVGKPIRTSVPAGVAGDGVRVGPAASRRNRPMLVVGVLVVLGFALVFALVWLRAGDREPVLAVARTVPAGQTITAADLKTVRVSADTGVGLLAASARASVVGRPAATPLLPGMLLTRAQVGEPAVVGPGDALVALGLKAGQFPPGLSPGTRVRVVDTGPPNAAVTSTSSPGVPGVVMSTTDATTSGAGVSVVTVKVAEAIADRLATWSAAGRAAVVVVAR